MEGYSRPLNRMPQHVVTEELMWSVNDTVTESPNDSVSTWYESPVLHVLATVVGSALLASTCLILWRITTGRRSKAEEIVKVEHEQNLQRMLRVYESIRVRSSSRLSTAGSVDEFSTGFSTSTPAPCSVGHAGVGKTISITVTEPTPETSGLDVNQNLVTVTMVGPTGPVTTITDANMDREETRSKAQQVTNEIAGSSSAYNYLDELDQLIPLPNQSPLAPPPLVPPPKMLPLVPSNVSMTTSDSPLAPPLKMMPFVSGCSSMVTNDSPLPTPTIIQLNDNVFICSSSRSSYKGTQK